MDNCGKFPGTSMMIGSDGKEINTVSSVTVISDHTFEQEVFEVEKPVLVYFWASWCGPCRLVSPSIDWVAKTYGERLKVVKLEVDSNPDSVAKYKVEGVPALRIFKDNKLIATHEGAIGKQQLQSFIDTYIS